MRFGTFSLCLLLTSVSPQILASGVDDLNQALDSLAGTSPIEALYQINYVRIEDEGEDQKLRNGDVAIKLVDNDQGLSVNYNKVVMALIEQESQAKIDDEEADTPTLNAIGSFGTRELKNALNAANQLKRTLSQAQFQQEQNVEYQGQNVRQLTFNMPLESIIDNKRTRDYVDDFNATLEVLIDENGVPLQTVTKYQGKGRAYIVLSMQAEGKTTVTYRKYGDRLLRTLTDVNSKYDSTFGKSEFIESNELRVTSAPLLVQAN